MVSQTIVDTCALQQKGVGKVNHVHGTTPNVPSYLINIILPNVVRVQGVRVLLGKFEDMGFDVLVGMDIIGKGDFAVSHHGGRTKFTFRFPAQADIDFVREDRRANMPGMRATPSPQKRANNRRKRK